MQIPRIRLTDKTSRRRPRPAVLQVGQAHEPEVLVEVLEWIAPAPSSPELVLVAQPPAQPRCGVVVECSIRLADGPHLAVVRPATLREIQLRHLHRGLLPARLQVGQIADSGLYDTQPPFAMVITDLHMPEMDGYSMVAAIRQHERDERRPPVPILALTANAMEGEAQRARLAGMDNYATKPLALAQLKEALENWLGR